MLVVDVLGCTGSTDERAGLLHKIIQIAAELKSTMGNMFGFAAVMRALELPQVKHTSHRLVISFKRLFLVTLLVKWKQCLICNRPCSPTSYLYT